MLAGCSFAYVPVTVCNFEAENGVSSGRSTYRNVLDTLRLRESFPPGVIEESLKLQARMDGSPPWEKRGRPIRSPFLLLFAKPFESIRAAHGQGRLPGAVRYAVSLFLPFCLVRWWLKKRYGHLIDASVFHYPGFFRRTIRLVKFACPYGLVCVFDVFAKGSGK